MKRLAACVVAIVSSFPAVLAQQTAGKTNEPMVAMISLEVTDSRGKSHPGPDER